MAPSPLYGWPEQSMMVMNLLPVVLVHDVLGSLRDTKPPTLAPKQVRQLCHQIVQGVSFLHSHGVVHGDLHAGNIGICLPNLDEHSEDDILDYFGHPEIHLVLPCQPPAQPESLPLYQVPSIELGYYYKQKDASFTKSPLSVEIMDLGNAALAGEDSRPSCTAPAVCAPEIMFNLVTTSVNSPSTFESDIWSLACTLYEIVRGSSLFHWARHNDALLEKMAKLCGELLPEWREHIPDVANTISTEGADTEWEMLVSHPTKDWTAADVAEFVALLRSILDNAHSPSPTCDMKVNPLFFVPFFIACVHVSAGLIPVPNQAFLKLVSQKWANNVRWKHEASFQLQYDWNDLTSIPSDFWERAMNLGDRVRKYAGDRLNDYSNTPFAGRIEQFKVTVDETIAYTARMKDEMHSTYGVNLEAFTIDLEKLLQTLQRDMEVAFPPPGEAPHHEQRADRVSAALMKLEEGIVHLGAKYGMPEEQMRMHLDNLRPHIEHLLVMTGDLAEQHPVLLEVLLFSASIMIIPESWFLRPFLGAFGFGPYGPVKGN
ncbi:Dual specificity protein kinase KNS1 [Grifola frondosa]|uniref:Dual specificity protein kinase KNS1 n=1 Tax=Grifola frondosa TaxID=5627 RepID=A0A1C7MEZ6_GRIFR|nr:Dual specificity protein kinase KNS1 [Grifola frondosa]